MAALFSFLDLSFQTHFILWHFYVTLFNTNHCPPPLHLRHPIFTPQCTIPVHILMVQKGGIFVFIFTYIQLIKYNYACLWLCSFKAISHLSNKVGWNGKKEVIQVPRNDKCSVISFRLVQFCIVLTKVGEILWYYCVICIMFCHAECWYKVMTVKTVQTEEKEEQIISLSWITVNFYAFMRTDMSCHAIYVLYCSVLLLKDQTHIFLCLLNWHIIRLHTHACENYTTFVKLTYILPKSS
jgi:hypothetical protein